MEEAAYSTTSLIPRRTSDDKEIWFNRVDGREVVKELMRLIAGVEIEYTQNGNTIIKQSDYARMTLEGASALHVLLRTLINSVTSLTQFSEAQVNHHTFSVTTELMVWLTLNYKRYGMSRDYVIPLITSLGVTINAQLNRAFNGKEAEWVSMTHVRREEHGKLEQSVRGARVERQGVLSR